jgi:hypothetical protein
VPANQIMELYHAGELHSGSTGKVVNKKSQATAILLSYLRKENKIPEREKTDGQ